MAVLKCKMCGGDLIIQHGKTIAECEYCGTIQTVPTDDNDKKLSMFDRANRLRAECEFDKAAGLYESIAAEYPGEAECYWGLVLCKYGIEYVDDPATGRKIPTCHRTLPGSVLEDADFRAALRKADVISEEIYLQEAKNIDQIQKKILSVVAQEAPYDVFICYKETDDFTGRRTQDSAVGQDIYSELTQEGYRVFFSRITLKNLAGSEYEPYIFAALSSAKVMLVLGSQPDYFDAVWVKNEWSRYLDLMNRQKDKVLIPCYRNMDAYDMPRELRNLQALNMSDMMFFSALKANVERMIPDRKKESGLVGGGNVGFSLDGLIKRAYVFLDAEDWEKAAVYAERILDHDAEIAEGYMIRLLSKTQQKSKEDLSCCGIKLEQEEDYRYFLKFASDQARREMEEYAKSANLNILYDEAITLCRSKYSDEMQKGIDILGQLGNWKDARERRETYIIQRKELIYRNAVNNSKRNDMGSLERACEGFAKIPGWQDADEKLEETRENYREAVFREAVRLKNKKESNLPKDPDDKDRLRVIKWKLEDYNKAIELLESLLPHEKAQEEIDACENLKQERLYRWGVELMERDEVDSLLDAVDIFEGLAGWKDSDRKQISCYQAMTRLFKHDKKVLGKEIRAFKNLKWKLPLIGILMLLGCLCLFFPGLFVRSSAILAKEEITFLVLGTLLTATPVFAYQGRDVLENFVPNRIWKFLSLGYALSGYVAMAIPVWLVWSFVKWLGDVFVLFVWLEKIAKFAVIIYALYILGMCLGDLKAEKENFEVIKEEHAMAQENIEICEAKIKEIKKGLA